MILHRFKPVSYTHLDVYKRQVLRPSEHIKISKVEKDPNKLESLYQLGLRDAKRLLACLLYPSVPAEYGKEVLNAMKNAKIKGRAVNMEPANSR